MHKEIVNCHLQQSEEAWNRFSFNEAEHADLDFLWNICMFKVPAQVYTKAYVVISSSIYTREKFKARQQKVGKLNMYCKLNDDSTE